jgi:sorbitol-specific phosphotransferase system component IIA
LIDNVKQVAHTHPEKKRQLTKINLSRQTMASRRDDFVTRVGKALKSEATDLGHYSLALNESKDISGTAQLSNVVRGVDKDFNVTREMTALVPLRGTTKVGDL